MNYIVEYNNICEEFDTYRNAEIYCIEKGIPCEFIYENE